MEKEKLLVVEDDLRWTENYRRWLSNISLDLVIHSAESADKALHLLKINYYAVVLLDLSLHPEHGFDRSSEEVQKLIKNKPEGTKHIIISSHADKEDIQTGAFKYGAFDTFFKKQFETVQPFLDSVTRAVAASKSARPDFGEQAYNFFIGDANRQVIEHNILVNFRPENGIAGWLGFKEKFLNHISPIRPHKSKRGIIVNKKFIVGQFWSRALGSAISFVIGDKDFSNENAVNAISEWIGRPSGIETEIEAKGLKCFYFLEPEKSYGDFLLD